MTAAAQLDRISDQLARLIAIPSVTGDEAAVQETMAELFAESGMDVVRHDVELDEVAELPGFPGVEVDRATLPIVAAHRRGSRPGPRLMLLGHVDVVPPGEANSWTSPAFEPRLVGGNMYGRGACDMKGGVVAILEAVRLVAPDDLAGEIVAVAVPSEEDGGAGTFAALARGLTADACVITEPTDLDVVVAHAGAITFTLDVPGKAAHASVRTEGVSALDNLSYLVGSLAEDEAQRNAEEADPLMTALGLPYPTIIGRVAGGTWASSVMDRVLADGRYGVRLGQNCDEAEAELRRVVAAAAAGHSFLAANPPRVSVWGGRFDSAALPTDHPLPTSLRASASRATGDAPALIGVPYGADMRLCINHGNTPTVMYGPGHVRLAHAADEYVPIAQVAECAEVLATWIRSQLG